MRTEKASKPIIWSEPDKERNQRRRASLGEFEETEQEKIRPKLGNYAIGYLGVSFGLKYG